MNPKVKITANCPYKTLNRKIFLPYSFFVYTIIINTHADGMYVCVYDRTMRKIAGQQSNGVVSICGLKF